MKTATNEQLAALTVPATLPGVARHTTPTVVTDCVRSAGRMLWPGERGVVFGPTTFQDDRPCVWLVLPPSVDEEPDVGQVPLLSLGVDLTHATGRAHVAWAIGRNQGLHPESSPLELVQLPMIEPDEHLPEPHISIGPHSDLSLGGKVWEQLEQLDGEDETRLPDGSRWVDAEALRIIALHILGDA